MKVSILCADLSGNCLGRSYILARVLERRFDVEIVGPAFGQGVWEPLASERFAYRALPLSRSPLGLFELRRVAALADGDLLYANKPLAASYGAALWARLLRPRPLVLDIDDWDAGFVRTAFAALRGWPRVRYLAGSTLRPHLNHALWNNLLFDRLAGRADARTVSNSFLQRRFGGSLVWHGRDTEAFRPARGDRAALRRRHGLPAAERIVVFLGTPHPYKGLDDLIAALASMGERAPRLLLVGVGDDEPGRRLLARARERLGAGLTVFGHQPFARVPEFLALADAAVVPQRAGTATAGQMPAKLFDAMALGVPLVATAVSDIPEALDGAGWLVPPERPAALAAALTELLGDPDEAARRAAVARRRCERRFSWDAMDRELGELFETLAAQPERARASR